VSNSTGPSPFAHGPVWRWTVGVASVVLAAALALTAGVLSTRLGGGRLFGSGPAPESAAQPTTLTGRDTTQINALLIARSSAVLRRDRTAFLASIDPKATGFRKRQAALFDNLAEVPLAEWSYSANPARAATVPPDAVRRYGARAWATEVELRSALTGYDDQAMVHRQYFTFVHRSGRWYVGGDDDLRGAGLRTARSLWDFGPVTTRTSPHGLVLGHRAGREQMREILALVDEAVPRVTAVWRSWPQRAVVLVPGDSAEASAIVPNAGDLSQIAAVTAAELREDGPPLGERIVVNPGPFGALSTTGRQVVIQHELTHVATGTVTSAATPSWLSEGFADYVGYSGQPAVPASVARTLAAEVRAGRAPEQLPSAADFTSESPRLAQAYEAAWLACRLIAERVGQDGLIRLYRTVSGGPGEEDAALDSGLRSVLGVTTEQFLAAWRGYLRAQLA
jgi:hypothetical protein